ncbi:BON domain-containing protein [Aerosakkonema funiforme]|uniref:BON domain-containing protein n=2 Tax=Oscillatoriophycideae TaxID=1301283 RepID=A0A926VCK0_9CYAN|nr:BON domain-containing protein [Aerosakkonema funiforme]MBD2181414.1 BON domain-containing protein [Aerosakkonema funiforme FACHB-1375]
MKKLTPFILSGLLMFGAVACEASKTSSDAPNNAGEANRADQVSDNNANTNPNATNTAEQTNKAPDADSVKATQEDAQNKVRRAQANNDIRAREQRNNITGGDVQRADSDLASEVRSKLEVNIQKGQLTVDAEDGAVTVAGTVPTQQDLAKIDTLAKEIKGVKSVVNKATVAQATPAADNKNPQ